LPLPGSCFDCRVVTISQPDPRWPDEFDSIAECLRQAAGAGVVRIDHIGSTSIPLPAKDVIDVQITVARDDSLEPVAEALAARAWRRVPRIEADHHVARLRA